ncbi:hypothetical protein SeLEV6574_g08506 [Synchytrium endobioticum]|uniref:Uncharacterized protein n=1 Tax=Synchytrium endobioticum TaxID=286115 RepID=A0A507C1K2_9FUNG|nr:hypothetical protein SeLEV6574_g08506 [Synchytrium endobioticum]
MAPSLLFFIAPSFSGVWTVVMTSYLSTGRPAIQELENAATSGASTVPDPESVYTAVGANDDSEEAAKKKVLYTKKTIYNPQKGGYGGGMGGYGGRF